MNSIEKDAMLKEKFKAVLPSSFGVEPVAKTKLAVFDFDETLVQSQDMFYKLMIEAMVRLKLPCSEDIVKDIFAKWDKEYFGWGNNLEEQKVIYQSKYQPMITKLSNDPYFLGQMILFDGMKDTIKLLAKTDIALAIASSRDLTSILTFLRKEGIKDYFIMVEATEGGKNFEEKPNPSIVNYISQEIGVSLDNAVMIGDSVCDIKMGKNAGMKTIAAGYGKYSNKDKLLAEKPDALIKEMTRSSDMVFTIQKLVKSKSI